MKIAIVGAGIAGMSAAYDLSKKGHEITIFEAADYVGGLAAGFKESHWDWSVERFYHHWFQSDSAILGLIDELGWSDQLIFPRPVTVMFHQGKFYPFDSIPSALLYPGLGWGINKIRFGIVNLAIRFTNNWKDLEKFTVDEWMRKYAGDKAYEQVWEPMVVGKFGERYARQVNMAWMWARLKARTPRLGTFKGGFQAFSDKLAAKLSEKGVESKNYFYPVHLQPFYRKMFGYEEGNYPVTELISSLTFAIPFFSNISFEEQNYVYQTIAESLTEIKNETFD